MSPFLFGTNFFTLTCINIFSYRIKKNNKKKKFNIAICIGKRMDESAISEKIARQEENCTRQS